MTTRELLVETMADLLWERGYVGTSPGAVLKRSGVGQGSLYHHFAGKQDLAVAAIEQNAATLRTAAESALAGPGTAVERITAFLSRPRDVLRGCRIGRMTQDPDVVAEEALRTTVAEALGWVTSRIEQVIREGQQAGELDPALAPADIASSIVATLQGGYVLARAAADPEPFHRAVRGVLALLAAHALPAQA